VTQKVRGVLLFVVRVMRSCARNMSTCHRTRTSRFVIAVDPVPKRVDIVHNQLAVKRKTPALKATAAALLLCRLLRRVLAHIIPHVDTSPSHHQYRKQTPRRSHSCIHSRVHCQRQRQRPPFALHAVELGLNSVRSTCGMPVYRQREPSRCLHRTVVSGRREQSCFTQSSILLLLRTALLKYTTLQA
jgi:hypothetical protein